MKFWTKAGKLLTKMGNPLTGENPCVGACCLPDGSCIETCEDDCTSSANNGSFQGRCSKCSDPEIDCTQPTTYDCVNGVCVVANGSAGAYESAADCALFCGSKSVECDETTSSATGIKTRDCQSSPGSTGAFDDLAACESAGCDFPAYNCVAGGTDPNVPGYVECVESRSDTDAKKDPECKNAQGGKCCCCSGYTFPQHPTLSTGPDSGSVTIRDSDNTISGTINYTLSSTATCYKHGDKITLNVTGVPSPGYTCNSAAAFLSFGLMGKTFQNNNSNPNGDTATTDITLNFIGTCRPDGDDVGSCYIVVSAGFRKNGNGANFNSDTPRQIYWIPNCCQCEQGPSSSGTAMASTSRSPRGPGSMMRDMLSGMGGGNVV